MYSNNQWSFNPAVYQNIPYEQVDWASLAQQWIKMKETTPATTQGPAPPPAPVISTKTAETPVPTPTQLPSQPGNDIEGGEAPMDMDTKDDEASTPPVGAAAASGNWNQWGNWQSQWGWGWSGNSGSVPSTDTSPSATSNVDSKVKSTNNDSIAALNDVRNFPLVGNSSTTQVSSTFNYNNTGGTVIPPIIPKSSYPFNNVFPPATKNSSDNWHKGGKSSNRQAPQKAIPPEQFPILDAAKKKQLPAWIRDGLTKMEREKQKKMEKERMVQEKYIVDQIQTDHVEPEPAPMPVYFEEPQLKDPPAAMPEYPRRYSPDPAPSSRYQKRRSPSIPRQRSREPQTSRKTKDQIMEESMLKVRRILTEILLEATEKQVHLIAKEEHRRYRTSASAPQIRKSNALSSLTGNLGLDVYDSEDNSSDGERDRDDDIDSDDELKMIIEKKKRDFTLVEDEIERLIDDQEARERLIAQRDSKDEDDIDDEGNEDDEEDEPRARNNRDKDTGGFVSHHQRYPDHDRDRERQFSAVESRSGDDDRNDHRSSGRRNPGTASEPKPINGDTKSTSSAPPTGTSGSTVAPVDDPERSKKDSSSSSSNSNVSGRNRRNSKPTKRSHHRSRSSSSSSSSSSTSSSSSSSSKNDESKSSSDDDDTASGDKAGSDDSKSKRSKRKKSTRKPRRSDTSDKATSKRSKRRSSDSDSGSRKRSQSPSRSRYHEDKPSSSSSKRTTSKNTGSDDRSRRRRSPSYRKKSPSYHRSSSRREQSSKYKHSPSSSSSRNRRRDDYSPESKRSRYRSSSRESSRYKRR